MRSPILHAASAAAVPAGADPPAKKGLDFPKIAALAAMFFCSCFNYTLLQNMKDSLVVTNAGAEVLPFLGAYAVLPGSILFYMYHERLTKTLPERYVYYASLLPLLLFYVAFATVLYPMAPTLHPYHLLETWKAMLPAGLVGMAGMAVNWLFSLFFVMAELWGAVAISMLFWGLADDVCSMQEAKDVYPSLGMIANVGLIVAGAWNKVINNQLSGGDALVSLRMLVATICGMSGILFALKAWVDKNYMAEAHADAEKEQKKRKKQKGDSKEKDTSGLAVAFNVVKKSPKVNSLAVLVAAYFIVQKLFDFAWKAQLRLFFPSTVAYQAALADVAQMTGVATILLMASSKFAFHYLGWTGTALLVPLSIGISGGVFYGAAIAAQTPSLMATSLAAAIIPLGAVMGVVSRVASKAAKYSLFDPAKEMVYITMDRQEKMEGKSAVDLLGSYFGKSGASWLTQALVLVFGSLNRSMPFIAGAHVIVCLAWTQATLSLGKLMRAAETGTPAPAPSAASSSSSSSSATPTEVHAAKLSAAAAAAAAASGNGGSSNKPGSPVPPPSPITPAAFSGQAPSAAGVPQEPSPGQVMVATKAGMIAVPPTLATVDQLDSPPNDGLTQKALRAAQRQEGEERAALKSYFGDDFSDSEVGTVQTLPSDSDSDSEQPSSGKQPPSIRA